MKTYLKEPFIHLVYYKWQTQPDNSVSYNLCIKKSGGDIDSEYPRKRFKLSDLRREKLKIINLKLCSQPNRSFGDQSFSNLLPLLSGNPAALIFSMVNSTLY
jgi:hypothetical protein